MKQAAGGRQQAAERGHSHCVTAAITIVLAACALCGGEPAALGVPPMVKALESPSPYLTWIGLDTKKLTVTDRDGKVLWSVPCGIGRGNERVNWPKKSDFDRITPAGAYRINHVFPLGHPELEKMNAIDWPDLYKTGKRIGTKAYGDGFVAFDWTKPLDRPAPAAGPNVRGQFRRSKEQNESLFSLGIHGTNRDNWVGKASTGGCVRLYNPDIRIYIEKYAREGGLIIIGQVKPGRQ